MLLIPESRKRPITESLLYKQIVRFLEEEKIRDKFEIAFVSIGDGIISDFRLQISDLNHKSKIINHKSISLPPANFRSGSLWVKKAQIEQMADSIVEFIKTKKQENIKTISYGCAFKNKSRTFLLGYPKGAG